MKPKSGSTDGSRPEVAEEDSLLKQRITAPQQEAVPETGMPTAKAKDFCFILFLVYLRRKAEPTGTFSCQMLSLEEALEKAF